jgi:hypothetical protein
MRGTEDEKKAAIVRRSEKIQFYVQLFSPAYSNLRSSALRSMYRGCGLLIATTL